MIGTGSPVQADGNIRKFQKEFSRSHSKFIRLSSWKKDLRQIEANKFFQNQTTIQAASPNNSTAVDAEEKVFDSIIALIDMDCFYCGKIHSF